jgi:Uma2 family endonuclease
MSTSTATTPGFDAREIPIIAVDIPVIYEDEGQEEMGESSTHSLSDRIVGVGLSAHFAGRSGYQVLANLNLYYHRLDPNAYVSPDEMVVQLPQPLGDVGSYTVGRDGPAPLVTVEVLSKRSYQQQDLTNKPAVYASIKVAEYILVDTTGKFLPQRLLLKRLQPDGTWRDEQDADGGVTSRLGFRIILDDDDQVRVLDAATGRRYLRPDEIEAARTALERKVGEEQAERREADRRAREADERAREAERRVAEEATARAALEAEIKRMKEQQK